MTRGSTLTPDVLQAAVVTGKVSARAVAPGAKKPVRPAAKHHDEELDKLAPIDGEQDLSEQALAGGERGSDALLHRVSMVEVGAASGVSAGENNADGGDGADTAPVAAASAAASAGGGIGALPFVLGGLVAVGGGVALAGGGKKNSPPTVSATQAVTTAEDTRTTITIAAADADSDPLTYAASNPTNGRVEATGGTVVYIPNANFNGTDTFTVSVTDGKSPPVSQTVTVTVTPVNDAPVAAADVGAVVEDAAVLTGSVATNDSDVDKDTLTYALTTPVAGLTLAANGGYSFDAANAAYQDLAAGQTRAVVANYTVSDGKGGSAASTLTITVTGVNDAPVAAADVGAVVEDAAVLTGSVATNDSDVDKDTLTYALTAPVAGLTLAANGGYSFDAANAAYQNLAVGQTRAVVANYTVSDGKGGSAASTLTTTVTGVNDAPVVTNAAAALRGAATEAGDLDNGTAVAGTPSVSGTLTAADVDLGTTLVWSIVGTPSATYGAIRIDAATGVWTYTLNNALAATEALKEGEAVTQTYTARVTDNAGAFVDQTIVVTINGTNDVPEVTSVVGDSVGVLTEAGHLDNGTVVAGTASVSGTLTAADVDQATGLLWSAVGDRPATYGTFGINAATGVWTYTLDNALAATQALKEGEVVLQTYTARVTDSFGGFEDEAIVVSIVGTNDVPVVTNAAAALSGTVTEAGHLDNGTAVAGTPSVSGALTATDVDQATGLTWSVVGTPSATYGAIAVNAATGVWTYTLDNSLAATQALKEGEVVTQTYTVRVTDNFGAFVDQAVTVTVNGTNDVPVFAATPTVQGNEDSSGISFTVSATDVDTDDAVTYSAPSITARGGSIVAGANGSFTYTPLPDFNGTDTVGVTATDRSGAQVTQLVTFNIASNLAETRSIDVTDDSTATTYDANGSGFTLGDNFKLTDDSTRPTNAVIVNFATGDTIEVTAASTDYSFTTVGNDLRITFTASSGVINQIVIPGVANGFVTDEASAEDVLGWDFFNALTRAGSGPVGTPGLGGDLDIDNDSNQSTTALVSAAGGNIQFTENANVANNVRITSFTAGDKITVSNADASTYSFSAVGDDLVITANEAGVVSTIVISSVVQGTSFINDLASARTALGFDFFEIAASAVPAQSVAIDNGNVAQTFQAGSGRFAFTDNTRTETNAIIQGFGADDKINVSNGTVADYSFGTGDDPNDLVITALTGTGGVNVIVLDDVLIGSGGFVFDYASAVDALGYDFMSFG